MARKKGEEKGEHKQQAISKSQRGAGIEIIYFGGSSLLVIFVNRSFKFGK
jgi:hypothetical protein